MVNRHVMVLDDEPLTRVTVSAALDACEGVSVVCQAGSAHEALEFAQRNRVDAAFIDVYLGQGPSGIDVAWELRRRNPVVGLIFLTSMKDPRILGRQFRALPGGSLYLVKSEVSSMKDLVATLDQARTGAGKSAKRSKAPTMPFTSHQLEMLKLVSRGMSNSEIARELGVTEKAVEGTISRLSKLLSLSEESGGNRRVHIVRTYLTSIGLNLP